jgi:hypothetical protein
MWARRATGIEVCNRSARCEGTNGRQPHKISTLLLLAAATRSAHDRAGATGSVRHKRIRSNSDTIVALDEFALFDFTTRNSMKTFFIWYRQSNHPLQRITEETLVKHTKRRIRHRPEALLPTAPAVSKTRSEIDGPLFCRPNQWVVIVMLTITDVW